MDYDRASYQKPILGTAAGVAMDGAHFTASIDTDALGAGALTFLANISALVSYAASSWTVQESADGSTWTAVAASDLVEPMPANGALTSMVFHVGYIGKKRYVKAAFTSGGSETGQITALSDAPVNAAVFDA